MTLNVGDKAPDFSLKDHNEKEVRLSELRGKNVLLSFHPLAWTGVCAKQMQALEANHERFEALNTISLGISINSVPTKEAWAKELGVEKLSLLSDFHPLGAVTRSFGLYREGDGFSERANIIIDEKGIIAFIKVYDLSELPDIEEIINIFENM